MRAYRTYACRKIVSGNAGWCGALKRSLCTKHSVRGKKLSQQDCCNKWLDKKNYIIRGQAGVKWFRMTVEKFAFQLNSAWILENRWLPAIGLIWLTRKMRPRLRLLSSVQRDLQMVFWIFQLISHARLSQRDDPHREKRYRSSSKELTFWVDALKYKKWSPMMPARQASSGFFFVNGCNPCILQEVICEYCR